MARRRFLSACLCGTLVAVAVLFHSPAEARRYLSTGVVEEFPPYSFVDARSSTVRGFCIDLTKLLAANMDQGLRLSAQPTSEKLQSALENGRVDLICGVFEKPPRSKAIQLIETNVSVERKIFVNKLCVTVTCLKDLPGHTLVVVKGQGVAPPPDTPHLRVIEADSQLEALRLLDENQAEVFLSECSLTTLYMIQKNDFRNIKEVGMPFETAKLALAVRKDDALLLKDLSIALGQALDGDHYRLIRRKWLGQNAWSSFWDTYLKHVLYALGAFAAILLFFALWNRTLHRKVQAMTRSLRRSEKKYRDLIEFSPEMIHLVAQDGHILLSNSSAAKRLGDGRENRARRNLAGLAPSGSAEDIRDFLALVFARGYGKRELAFEAMDGTRMPVEMIATIVSLTDDEQPLACCFSRDMTERKRLEEELIQTERLAIIGQMAAGLAHEINNPLGIILANAEDLLGSGACRGEEQEGLETIARNAVRAGDIIDNLLSFTRPVFCMQDEIDLPRLIDESLLFLKQKLKKKCIAVHKHIPPDITMAGDENQIQQMLINLMLNAIQAMEPHGSLTLRAFPRDGQGGGLRLEIEDTGVGITAENQAKLFTPFFTSGKNNGVGLGLFISKTIVERHGGGIFVRSAQGQGTVMAVDLPGRQTSVDRGGNPEPETGSSNVGKDTGY